jgi:hypothetical protein
MHTTRLHRLLAGAVAALALVASAAAASASAAVLNDPDEPAVAARDDIEWAGASRLFVTGTGWLYTHTIKTRAPYATRPCLDIRTPAAGGTYYGTCAGPGSLAPVTVSQSPAGAPDTISLSFNATAIGSPASYEWIAWTGTKPVLDRAPDAGWSVFPPKPSAFGPQIVIGPAPAPEYPYEEPDPREDHPRPGPGGF